jgi:hypothetical protein
MVAIFVPSTPTTGRVQGLPICPELLVVLIAVKEHPVLEEVQVSSKLAVVLTVGLVLQRIPGPGPKVPNPDLVALAIDVSDEFRYQFAEKLLLCTESHLASLCLR